jgi:hypothetical protein
MNFCEEACAEVVVFKYISTHYGRHHSNNKDQEVEQFELTLQEKETTKTNICYELVQETTKNSFNVQATFVRKNKRIPCLHLQTPPSLFNHLLFVYVAGINQTVVLPIDKQDGRVQPPGLCFEVKEKGHTCNVFISDVHQIPFPLKFNSVPLVHQFAGYIVRSMLGSEPSLDELTFDNYLINLHTEVVVSHKGTGRIFVIKL